MKKKYTVGIIGAGVSGVVTALKLSELGIDNVLFEKETTVVNGPPFCHLHAGGNLYPDISDEQCRILMKQSIDMAKLFPQSIDQRPTFISIPKTEKYQFKDIQKRLDMLVSYYKELINEDPSNQILGLPEQYYRIYTKEDLKKLANHPTTSIPDTPDQWMSNAIKLIDYEKLKTPVLLVQEFGWNLFRLGAQAQIALESSSNCDLQLDTKVTNIKDVREDSTAHNWEISTDSTTYSVDFLVNSCGFRTGNIDQSLALTSERLIEFKAAYVAKWKPIEGLLPELIFHGERGTPHGMAQLTPYCDDLYQIHGMTEEITLFKNGLVKSTPENAQPEFEENINQRIEKGWTSTQTTTRTQRSINYVANFVPSFKDAQVGGPPLFGAQQIPGDDPTLRVGEVCFSTSFYARSEIVKASSALTVANQIVDKLNEEKVIQEVAHTNQISMLKQMSIEAIDELSASFAYQRGYPKGLSKLVIECDMI